MDHAPTPHFVSLLSPPTSSCRLTDPLPSESKSRNRFRANSCIGRTHQHKMTCMKRRSMGHDGHAPCTQPLVKKVYAQVDTEVP